MASSFMGLYVQREALVAAQKSLDIVGNNISNIKTKGYARQKVDVCSVANTGYNLFYDTSVSMAGQGVDVVGVTQYRDALLDEKVRNYTTSYNEYGVKQTVMSQVETALDNIEAESSGFAVNFAKFKEALQSFTADHADRAEIANVAFQSAKSAVQQLNYMNNRLTDISQQTLGDAKNTVADINTLLADMASLNKQIVNSYVSMGYIEMNNHNYQVENPYGPLELKDQMNVYIDKLSEYGNVDFKEEYNGSFTITFAQQVVVFNDQYAQMAMTQTDPKPFDMAFEISSCGKYLEEYEMYTGLMKADKWNELIVANGGSVEEYVRNKAETVNITSTDILTSGSLRGYLDVYNGNGIFATEPSEHAISRIANNTDKVNDLAGKIAALHDGNALTDEKKSELAELVDKLGEYADAVIEYDDNGKDFKVTIAKGALTLVNNGTAGTFTADKTSAAVKLNLDGTDVTSTVGDAAEGVKNTYQGIEYYRDMLNSFAKTITDKLNGLYKDFGFKLFDYGEDFHKAAERLRVTDDWESDPEILAHPERFATGSTTGYDELSNDYIHKVLGALKDENFKFGFNDVFGNSHFDAGSYSFEKFIAHISDNLGVQIGSNKKILDTTEIMLTVANDKRNELMAVSMDEEGVDMMNFQKWYNAIARMITTLDEELDKVINDMGLVGR